MLNSPTSLSVTNFTWSEGISFEPGQTGQLILEMANHGSMGAETASMEISSSSPWLSFSSSGKSFTVPVNLTVDAFAFNGITMLEA